MERKQVCEFTGAPIGGAVSKLAFSQDEAGQLEVAVSTGPNAAVGVLSAEDAQKLVGLLEDAFGKTAPAKPKPVPLNPTKN